MSNKLFTCINRGCRRKYDPQPGPFPDNHLINGYCWDCNLSQFNKYGSKSLDNVRLTRERATTIKPSPSTKKKYILADMVSSYLNPFTENTEENYND